MSLRSKLVSHDYEYPRYGDVPAVLFYTALVELLSNKPAVEVRVFGSSTYDKKDDHPLNTFASGPIMVVKSKRGELVYYRPNGPKIEVALSRQAVRDLDGNVVLSILTDRDPNDY